MQKKKKKKKKKPPRTLHDKKKKRKKKNYKMPNPKIPTFSYSPPSSLFLNPSKPPTPPKTHT